MNTNITADIQEKCVFVENSRWRVKSMDLQSNHQHMGRFCFYSNGIAHTRYQNWAICSAQPLLVETRLPQVVFSRQRSTLNVYSGNGDSHSKGMCYSLTVISIWTRTLASDFDESQIFLAITWLLLTLSAPNCAGHCVTHSWVQVDAVCVENLNTDDCWAIISVLCFAKYALHPNHPSQHRYPRQTNGAFR